MKLHSRSPQFGAIMIPRCTYKSNDDFHPRRAEMHVRLSDEDTQLSPIPGLGGEFILRSNDTDTFEAEYTVLGKEVQGKRYCHKAKVDIDKDEIRPLLTAISEDANGVNWHVLRKTGSMDRIDLEYLREAFPRVTFPDNQAQGLLRFVPVLDLFIARVFPSQK